jgi:hypothetical protein
MRSSLVNADGVVVALVECEASRVKHLQNKCTGPKEITTPTTCSLVNFPWGRWLKPSKTASTDSTSCGRGRHNVERARKSEGQNDGGGKSTWDQRENAAMSDMNAR